MQRAALELAGLDGDYEAVSTGPGQFAGVVDRLRSGELDGVNVTMPLKLLATEQSEILTPEAERSGSTNTLRCQEGVIEGHSTDVVAFQDLFAGSDNRTLLILGSGGSARAALAAWPHDRAHVSTRRPDGADILNDDRIARVAWGDPLPGAVVVNATPIGMAGEELSPGLVEEASLLIDLPYGSETTPAVARGQADGIKVVDGIEFLARQAAASFLWWTGIAVDFGVLLAEARKH